MTFYDLELHAYERSLSINNGFDRNRAHHSTSEKKDLLKTMVLSLSEVFIFVGTSLHNLYQPTIEEILIDYKTRV